MNILIADVTPYSLAAGGGRIPPDLLVTSLRPGIVIMLSVELMVSLEPNIKAANLRKMDEKYCHITKNIKSPLR